MEFANSWWGLKWAEGGRKGGLVEKKERIVHAVGRSGKMKMMR